MVFLQARKDIILLCGFWLRFLGTHDENKNLSGPIQDVQVC